MFDGRFRAPIEKAVRPVGQLLRKTGMSPDHLTILGIAFAVVASFAIGTGALRGGLVLVILAAVPDMLDGALAKASGTSSQRGAFFDSVVDRVTDSVLFGGVAWLQDVTDVLPGAKNRRKACPPSTLVEPLRHRPVLCWRRTSCKEARSSRGRALACSCTQAA